MNITKSDDQILRCFYQSTVKFDASDRGLLYVTCATIPINIATSLLAIAGNCIFLWTMRNSPRIHSPSNLFLANLALSDLMVGAIVQPLFTAYKVAELLQEYTCDVHIAFSFCAWTSVGVSFLTLVSVSAERYFTIFKSFENPIALREGHVYVLCTCIWTFAVLFMFLRFWGLPDWIFHTVSSTIVIISFVTTGIIYCKIYQRARGLNRSIRCLDSIHRCPVGLTNTAMSNDELSQGNSVTRIEILCSATSGNKKQDTQAQCKTASQSSTDDCSGETIFMGLQGVPTSKKHEDSLSHTTRNSAHKQTHSADDHTLQSKARSKPCHPLDTPKNKDTNNLSEKPAFYRRVVGIQSNKSVKTVALVTGLFFLCYLPTLAIMLAYITHGYSSLIKTLYSITDTVVFMNSCFNPVIYYYKNQEIRQAVKKIFCIRHKINSGL